MSTSTQNDWEDEIKDMLCDAGLKPIHFKLNNSGVRILNRIKKELADARREVIEKVEKELEGLDCGFCNYEKEVKERLATLREEEGAVK